MGKKILITGASSGLGKEVYENLKLSFPRTISTIGRSKSNDIICDLSQPQNWNDIVSFSPDVVLHFAACVPNNKDILDDDASAGKTVAIDQNIFDLCKSTNALGLYASGCSLYDKTAASPVDEAARLSADLPSPYLQAKKTGDRLFSVKHCGKNNFNVILTRFEYN